MRRLALPTLATVLLAGCSPPAAEAPQQYAADATTASRPAVSFQAERVVLDYGAREMVVVGKLMRGPGGERPDSVWIWPYFTNPAFTASQGLPPGSWSDQPMPVGAPFADGDTATVEVRGPFHWSNDTDLPRTGYFARVHASALSADDARLPSARRVYDPEGATLVDTHQ